MGLLEHQRSVLLNNVTHWFVTEISSNMTLDIKLMSQHQRELSLRPLEITRRQPHFFVRLRERRGEDA